jgi:cytochrome c oxidase cbb3-type subunit 3
MKNGARYREALMSILTHGGLAVLVLALGVMTGCGGESDAAQAPAAKKTAASPSPGGSGYVDGGDSMRFVDHPENLPVGFPPGGRMLSLINPYEGDKRALGVGAQLYVSYNCIDCHGADGSGAMAPAFTDGRWHFGGSPAAVFESIYQGRPDGMPQWGGRISNNEIWMLTAYVRSLASKDLSTENFTGKTIERTGH